MEQLIVFVIVKQDKTLRKDYMFYEILFFCAGLIVGWNLMPQPTWVKIIYDKIMSKLFQNS